MSGMDAVGWVVAAPLVVVVVWCVCVSVCVRLRGKKYPVGSVSLRYLPRAPWK